MSKLKQAAKKYKIATAKQPLLEKIGNVILAWAATFLIVVAINIPLSYAIGESFHPLKSNMVSFKTFLYMCIVAPFVEELIFRHIPLKLVSHFSCFDKIKWYLVAIIAVIFGWLHGSYFNVLVQGIGGFFFGWVYIKNRMSYISAVSAHFLWNFMLGVVFPMLVEPCTQTFFFPFKF